MSERESRQYSKNENEKGNAILRQELKNLTPKCNVKFAVICNSLLGILFFTFSIPILYSTSGIEEFVEDYTKLWYILFSKLI